MRSIHDVIREREIQAEKLKDEIEKLREAARILEEADATPAAATPTTPAPSPVPVPAPAKRWP